MTFQQDTEETAVIFRKYPNIRGGEVIALFPEIPGDYSGYTCSSYVHVGQLAYSSGMVVSTRREQPSRKNTPA